MSSYDFTTTNHQENLEPYKKRAKSPKISFVETNNDVTRFFLNDDGLSLMKTSPLDLITNDKTRQSNSFDSGCYDRSSSSADTQSVMSLNIHQASSSVPSARFTSGSTRRSNTAKKVSFEDQPTKVIVTTATYV